MRITTEDFINNKDEVTIRLSVSCPFHITNACPNTDNVREVLTKNSLVQNVVVTTSFFDISPIEYAIEFVWTGNREKLNSIVTEMLIALEANFSLTDFLLVDAELGRKGLSETGTNIGGLPSFNQVTVLVIAFTILFALILGLGVFREVKGIV